MLFALIANLNLHFWLIDFARAYLNSKPQGINYLEILQGFKNHYKIPGVDTVLIMNLTIYGTMDGANNWFCLLNKTFTELSHHQSRADPCMRIQNTTEGYTISSTYTNDISAGSSSVVTMDQAKRELAAKFKITDLGTPNKVLSMSIMNHTSGDISIHQKPLITKALVTFRMENANPKYTPLPPGINLVDSQPMPIPPNDTKFMCDKDYRSVLGMLNHIANGTRPDIAFSVMILMHYASDPHPTHWRLVQHLLAYLKTTSNLVITYRKDGVVKPYGYSDSSYADESDTWKSSAGFVFISSGGPVSWKAKTQRRVSTSTGEAEYVGVFEAGKQAKWVCSWFYEVDQYFNLPITIYYDNDAAVALTKNFGGHTKIKHVNVKTHWIREAINLDDIIVVPIDTAENIADIFMKSLS